MTADHIGRHGYELFNISLILAKRQFVSLTDFNKRSRMCNTGGDTDYNRSIILFADLVCCFNKILTFLAVGRFDTGSVRTLGYHSSVLFIL